MWSQRREVGGGLIFSTHCVCRIEMAAGGNAQTSRAATCLNISNISEAAGDKERSFL